MDLFSDQAIARERTRQELERRAQQERRKTEWTWIQEHEPALAELLTAMQAADMRAQGIEWIEGGPWAKAA